MLACAATSRLLAAFQGDVEQPGLRIAVSEQAVQHLVHTGHRLSMHTGDRAWIDRDLQAGAALVSTQLGVGSEDVACALPNDIGACWMPPLRAGYDRALA